jgi:WD40 repeat protein
VAAAVGLVLLALVSATLVSTLAAWRISRAREGERQALRRADGLRLTALSEAVRAKKPDLALLLAIEGAQRYPGEMADNALWAGLDVAYQKRTLQSSASEVHTARFSPDGREVLTLCNDHVTRRWDAATYQMLGEIQGRKVRSNVQNNQGVWKEVEGLAEWPVTAAYTTAGLRLLTQWEKGFTVRDERGQVIGEIAHAFSARNPSAQFSPDGTRVALVFGQDPPPEEGVFDVRTGKKLFSLSGHRDYIRHAAFSPDGSRLVTCSQDRTARVLDARTGRFLVAFTGHTADVNRVAFSPSGKQAVTWGQQVADGNVVARLWEVETGREVARLEVPREHHSNVGQVFFSPDGTKVVTCNLTTYVGTADPDDPSAFSPLRIWDAGDGEPLHDLLPWRSNNDRSLARVSAMSRVAAMSRDGRLVACGGEDGVVRLFDAAQGKLLREMLGHEGEVRDVMFHPDGRTLLSASRDGTARLWDLGGTGQEQGHGVWGNTRALAAASDGRRLLLARMNDPVALLVDRLKRRTHRLAGHRQGVDFVGFSGNGTKALTVSGNVVHVWDLEADKLVRQLPHDGAMIDVAALSLDGKVAFTQARSGPARFWDVASGKVLRSLHGPISVAAIQTALFSPARSHMLTTTRRLVPPLVGGNTKRPTLWDVATGKRLHEFVDDPTNKVGEFLTLGHGTSSFAVLSPDGARVLTCSTNGSARLWNADSGERGPRLTGHTDSLTWGAFSPDGRLVATASKDGTARLWDAQTGKELRVFRGHEAGLTCVHFGPQGKRLVTAGADRKVRVVEVATGRLARHFPLPPGRDTPFATFLDDETIITMAANIVRIWPVDALAEARRRKPRELTPAEREKYEVDGVAP